MIIGVVGHTDHGKSSLIKALTGVNPSRLQEERSRGITIDIGFAYSHVGQDETMGFLDMPGHERFIQNMLTGITGIDYVLLVIAADDGPKPQTIEHLEILNLLEIDRGAIVLSKTDKVPKSRVSAVKQEIQELIQHGCLANSPVFQVSTLTLEGLQELHSHLEHLISSADKPKVKGEFRMTVDRSFTVAGSGTVVTGTVLSGQVRPLQHLMITPLGRSVRVRGIHSMNRPAQEGRAGQRCALQLANVDASEVKRGDWVVSPELHHPISRLDARIKKKADGNKPLPGSISVHVHIGAAHVTGRLIPLFQENRQSDIEDYAQLVLERPIVAVNGDRFILRNASAEKTIGGGKVLDITPPARNRHSHERFKMLKALSIEDPDKRLQAVLENSPEGLLLGSYAANNNMTRHELTEALAKMAVKHAGNNPAVVMTPQSWDLLTSCIEKTLQEENAHNRQTPGLNTEQLRLRVCPGLDRSAFVHVLNDAMSAGKLQRTGSWWQLYGYEVLLSPDEDRIWQLLEIHLVKNSFQPPRVRDLAELEGINEVAIRALLSRVCLTGKAYRIAHDHYFTRAAVVELAHCVRMLAHGNASGVLKAAEFRDRIGTGRKLAIQILEFFDRAGLTRRIGNEHRLRDENLDF